jgi:RTX calcium-binding nonapeptide repeat (4 copies)
LFKGGGSTTDPAKLGLMKKGISIVLMLLAAQFATVARAEGGPITLLLSGGPENNAIHISLSADGREYVIDSIAPLEVGGDLCSHATDDPTELFCRAPAIAGFEVNVDGGADVVALTPDIPIPATLRGGPGRDRLVGGGAADKIIGGGGNDVLGGRRGDDWIFGGPGDDSLFGGPGDDQLRGGPGDDTTVGGPGDDTTVGGPGRNNVLQ